MFTQNEMAKVHYFSLIFVATITVLFTLNTVADNEKGLEIYLLRE